jgi:hypothetical protein
MISAARIWREEPIALTAFPWDRPWTPWSLHYKVEIRARDGGELLWVRPYRTKQEAIRAYFNLVGLRPQTPEFIVTVATLVTFNAFNSDTSKTWLVGGVVCPSGVFSVDYFAVGGGGNGGSAGTENWRGGGGGGGETLLGTLAVTPGTGSSVSIGSDTQYFAPGLLISARAGGSGGKYVFTPQLLGVDDPQVSQFAYVPPPNGGCGGGGGSGTQNGVTQTGSSAYSQVTGKNGGAGKCTTGSTSSGGGGGGGMGSAGNDVTGVPPATANIGGNGGTAGFSAFSGVSTGYAAGGGGGGGTSGGNGGSGLGGAGGTSTVAAAAAPTPNTGSGGGGAGTTSATRQGGNGSAGVLMFSFTVAPPSGGFNMPMMGM